MNKSGKIARIIINIVNAAMVFAIWISLFFKAEDAGFLESGGLVSLRYYTVLSNLLSGIASVVWLIGAFRKKESAVADKFKYFSTVAVMVTFMVVAAFLAPLYGVKLLFNGSNLWYHLILPLLAIAEFLIFNKTKMGWKDNLFVTVSVWVYGTFYMLNNLINGTGVWPDTNDWYGFLNWGWGPGIVIFVGVAVIAFVMGLILRGILKLKKV